MKIARTFATVALLLFAERAHAQGSIAGTVYDSLNARAPLANATVVLVERMRTTTTDSKGRFQFDTVPDGRYTVGFKHAALDSLGMQMPAVAVEVKDGRRATVKLSTPGRAATYKRFCPGAYEDETGFVIGRARDVDDQSPLADATVTADWTAETGIGAGKTSQPVRVSAKTNSHGLYVLCGLPSSEPLLVHAEFAGVHAGPAPVWLDDRLIDRVDLRLSRRDGAALATTIADTASGATHAAGTASLRGTVVGDNGRPMRNAAVDLMGTKQSVHTDSAGAFRIDHIPAGTRTIVVRYIGLQPMTASMDFATSEARDTLFSIGKKAQALRPVTIRGEATPSWMERSGFEFRRKMGLGGFMTEEEVKRHTFPELVTVLEGIRGVRVNWGGAKGVMGIPFMMGMGHTCAPNYFLDGSPFPSDFEQLSGLVPPESIKGIEVYSSVGTVPVQYDNFARTGCGSIVIWTR
jgi:hypothetical protein